MPHRRRRDDTRPTSPAALVGLLALAAIAASCSHIEGAPDTQDGGSASGRSPGDRSHAASFALERSAWRHHVRVDESGFQLAGDAATAQEQPSPARLGWGRQLGSPSARQHLRSETGQRIEVDLGWSVGVLADHPDGVEQSWEIATRPATPALEVRVPVDGALHLGSGEDGLVFRTTDHEYLIYGHAVWIDAEGRRTPVPARFDGEDIALTVGEDVLDGSAYPAVLDPIIGTARSLTPTQLTNANADQENPDIAIGATSRLVVWSDDRTGVVPGLFGTFQDHTGTLEQRYAFRIGGGRLTGTPVVPSVAYAGGIYLVAWASYDTVYAVRVAEGGGVLDTTPLRVLREGSPRGATVATDGVEFVVTWVDGGTPAGVRARRVMVDGTFPAEPIWVQQDTASYGSVRAEHDPAGGYWVVFDDDSSGNRDLRLVRLAADASVRDLVPFPLAAGFADQASPDIAFSGAGQGMVVYRDSSTSAVHGVTVTEGGGTLSSGTPTRISSGSGEQAPRVVHDGSTYHVGWISTAPGSPSPQVATIAGPVRADGVTLGGGSSFRIALAVDAASTLHAVWQATNTQTDAIDIYRRTRPASSGVWNIETYLVSQAPSRQHPPVIANNSSRSLAAWVERTPGGKRVFAARINPLGEFEDVEEFPVGRESLDAVMVGVYSNGTDFLVAWQARELRSFASGSAVVWVPTVARVSTAGVPSAQFDCGARTSSMNPVAFWLDSSVFPTRYVSTFVDGDVIYNANVNAASCGSRFLYEDATVSGSTHLVSTPHAVYFVSSTGDLHRVNQTTALGGGSGAPLGVGASELATLDVMTGFSDTIAYSNSPPSFPLDQRVGVVRVSPAGAIEWHVPDLADHVETTANPQLTRFGADETFVVWRQTENSIVGQRLGAMGERMDPAPVTIDAEPQSRYLGDIVTDFLDRSMLVYSAVLPEQGWATRIRARAIDFRFDEGDALGEACTTGFDCASGICADGVCCNAACGYSSPDDCQACSIAAGGAVNGTCSTLVGGTECRASAGECDVAEVCDGTSIACPANALAPADSVCGDDAEGPCDLADRCSGASVTCEPRGLVAAGTSCRPSRGGCDAEDTCDGAQAACADAFLAAGAVCRGSAGACDVPETCDGATDVCPTDLVEVAGVSCRDAVGGCDVQETCDGSSAACPTDVVLGTTQVCRVAAGPCDREESCDGIAGVCPPDAFFGTSTECRPAAGECDVPEHCDGSSPACADDAAAVNGSTCGSDALACESASCVDGACVSTPVFCEGGVACSEAMGGCPAPPVEPEPTAMGGCGCRAAGPGGPELPGAIIALLGVALALLGRRIAPARR